MIQFVPHGQQPLLLLKIDYLLRPLLLLVLYPDAQQTQFQMFLVQLQEILSEWPHIVHTFQLPWDQHHSTMGKNDISGIGSSLFGGKND